MLTQPERGDSLEVSKTLVGLMDEQWARPGMIFPGDMDMHKNMRVLEAVSGEDPDDFID